jgi:hypothetical protein
LNLRSTTLHFENTLSTKKLKNKKAPERAFFFSCAGDDGGLKWNTLENMILKWNEVFEGFDILNKEENGALI